MYNEDTIIDKIQEILTDNLANYDDDNTVIGDTSVLDKGHSRAIILFPGRIIVDDESPVKAFATNYVVYEPYMVVCLRYTQSDTNMSEDMRAETQSIMSLIDRQSTLGGLAQKCYSVSAERPSYMGLETGEGPYYLSREIVMRVERIEEIS